MSWLISLDKKKGSIHQVFSMVWRDGQGRASDGCWRAEHPIIIATIRRATSGEANNSSSVRSGSRHAHLPHRMASSSIIDQVNWWTNHYRVATDHKISFSLCMILVNIEISIMGIFSMSITNDLQGFSQMNWIITEYLIIYKDDKDWYVYWRVVTNFLFSEMITIWSKFSVIFDRKSAFLITLSIFITFSGACDATQTMTTVSDNQWWKIEFFLSLIFFVV